MGSPDSDKDADTDEKPQHRVRITMPFKIGKYLVTQEQWEAVMGNNPSHFKGPKNPVENVSWVDCQQFLEKLNAKLRTEHWKFRVAHRSPVGICLSDGGRDAYCFGDDATRLGDYAWYLRTRTARRTLLA